MPMGTWVIRRRLRMVHHWIRAWVEGLRLRWRRNWGFFEFKDKGRCLFETFSSPLPLSLWATLAYIWWCPCVACCPILVNLRAFQNNQGWVARRRRQRNSNEPFSRKAWYWGLWNLPPPVYLPPFFLQKERERGVKPVAAGGGWKDQCVAHLGHLGSSWPAAERNFGLAAMMGWGEPRRIAPSSSFFRHQLPRLLWAPVT